MQFTFGKKELKSLGKGALIAIAGALIVYIPQAVQSVDWGTWTPFAVAIASIAVNFLRLWASDTTQK